MKGPARAHTAASMILAALFCATAMPGAAAAAQPDTVRLQVSPYTQHFAKNPEYRRVWLVGVEREQPDHSIYGVALFRNSFGQASVYAYPWGALYRDVFGVDGLYFKWSAGILYGYRGRYEDKLALNWHGLAPAIVPALGWTFTAGYSIQVDILGTSALMFQVSKDL